VGDDGGHYYHVDGGFVYPSVTTILSAVRPEPKALARWKEKHPNHKEILKDRATFGTLAHFRILNQLSDVTIDLPEIPMAEWGDLDSIETRLEIAEMMFHELDLDIGYPRVIETLVVNHDYKYAGRFDMLAMVDDIWTLCDLKTSKEAYDSHKLQLGGYYGALPEHKKPERAMLICIHPYAENNPTFRAHVEIVSQENLINNCNQFWKYATEYHKTHSMDGIEANCS
jgi:hypothetical protein